MVNHKRFDCEECGVSWKIKSRVIYGNRTLCVRCYRSQTSSKGWEKADKEATNEWRAKHRRRAFSYFEEKVLRVQWEHEKLSESQVRERLKNLRFKVLENNKKVYFSQQMDNKKKTFASEFAKLREKR